jgi:hypothetical protein
MLSPARPTLRVVPTLHAAHRPADDTTAEATLLELDLADHGGDYDQALASARAAVPEGHVLLHVLLDPTT